VEHVDAVSDEDSQRMSIMSPPSSRYGLQVGSTGGGGEFALGKFRRRKIRHLGNPQPFWQGGEARCVTSGGKFATFLKGEFFPTKYSPVEPPPPPVLPRQPQTRCPPEPSDVPDVDRTPANALGVPSCTAAVSRHSSHLPATTESVVRPRNG